MRNFNKENKENKVEYTAKVIRAHQFDDGNISIDFDVNGVTIYGARYIQYKTKEGKEGDMISLPSYKVEKDKQTNYYNHVWFPMSNELKENILDQVEKILK